MTDVSNQKTALDRIVETGFKIVIWDDRYSPRVWAAIGREYNKDFNEICQLTDSDDIEAAGFDEYISDKGSWLPVVVKNSVAEALDALTQKINSLPPDQIGRSTPWAEAVDRTYAILAKVSTGYYGIAMAIDQAIIISAKPPYGKSKKDLRP